MPTIPDPFLLRPDERFRAVARLLAAGLLRLRYQPAISSVAADHPCPDNSSNSQQDCLELAAELRLSVPPG